MGQSLANARRSDPVRSLDTFGPASDQIGPGQIKVGLRSGGVGFSAVVKDAVIAHYGSVKATAISLGNVDPSLMLREFGDGKFGRLEQADDAAKAAIALRLGDVFGTLSTPQARARQKLRDIKAALEEIEQALEHIA